MRVLLISHTCQSQTEGQPKAVELSKIKGIELKVLVPDKWYHYGQWRQAAPPLDSGFELEAGKVAFPWTGPGQFYLHFYPSLAKILRDFRPEIIDLWEEPWGLASAHAIWVRNRVLPSARIISETEQNIYKSLPPPFRWFCSYSLRNADFCVARNVEAISVLRKRGYNGPAEVVPNAVDAELFRPLDRGECRKNLAVDGFVVGYVGRLVEEKGLADFIDALAACPKYINAVLVGSGSYQPELERKIEHLQLQARVQILPPRKLEELPAIMNAIDCLVLPSRTTHRWKEQFGRVIIESHACGTPVIGSDSGAIQEVVGTGGVIVPERNVAALADAITRLSQNPDLCQMMGTAGRDNVMRKFTWKQVAESMYSIYDRVLNGGKIGYFLNAGSPIPIASS